MNTRQAIRDGVPKWLFKIIGPWLVGSLIGFVAFPTLNETFRIFPEAQMSFSLVSGGLFQAIYLLFKNTILNKMVLALAAGLAAYSATENPIIGAGVAGVLVVGLVVLSFFRKPETEPQKQVAQPPQQASQNPEEGDGGDAVEVKTVVGMPKRTARGASIEELIKIASDLDGDPIADLAKTELERRIVTQKTDNPPDDTPIYGKPKAGTIRRC